MSDLHDLINFVQAELDTLWTVEYIPCAICECGKEKHGFASHSTWCLVKD